MPPTSSAARTRSLVLDVDITTTSAWTLRRESLVRAPRRLPGHDPRRHRRRHAGPSRTAACSRPVTVPAARLSPDMGDTAAAGPPGQPAFDPARDPRPAPPHARAHGRRRRSPPAAASARSSRRARRRRSPCSSTSTRRRSCPGRPIEVPFTMATGRLDRRGLDLARQAGVAATSSPSTRAAPTRLCAYDWIRTRPTASSAPATTASSRSTGRCSPGPPPRPLDRFPVRVDRRRGRGRRARATSQTPQESLPA